MKAGNKPTDLFSQVYDQASYTLHIHKYPMPPELCERMSRTAHAILVPINSVVLTYIKRDVGFVEPLNYLPGLVGFLYTVPVIVNKEKTPVKTPQIVFAMTPLGLEILRELEKC